MPTSSANAILALFVEHAQLIDQHLSQLQRERSLRPEYITPNFISASPAALQPALKKITDAFGVEEIARETLLAEATPGGGIRLHPKLCSGTIVVVYRDPGGKPFHLAPIKDGYENIEPQVFGLHSVVDPEKRIYIAESEIKAIMCHQLGLQAISVQGVDVFTGKRYERLFRALRVVGARDLVIVYDNADYLNPKLINGRPNPKFTTDAKKTFRPEFRAYELALRLEHDGMQVGHVRLKDEWRVDGEADIDSVITNKKATEADLRQLLEAPLDHHGYLNMLPPDGAKRVRNLFAEGMIRRTGDGIYHYRSYPIDLSIDKIQDKKNGLQANVHFEWNLRIQCEERLYIDREKERASYSKKLAKRITDGSANHQGKPVGELIAKTLADAVEALRAKREEERKEALERRLELKQSGETVNALGREFVIRDNRIYLLKPVKEDESIEIEVSNCYLDLKRQETLDDGRERTLLYVADIVRGEHRTEIEFPHKDLCTAKLKEHLGARPDVYFEPLGHLQAVVAKRAETNPPEVVTINQKFGYQTDGCFVSPSVIIEPNGLILKNEDRPLRLDRIEHAAYLDILPMEDEDKLKALMGHILSDFLYVNDPLISGALLGHVGLAVCRRFLRLGGPFVLWVHGTTGLGKSMLAKAAQNFFGDFDTHRRCDGAATYQTWRSTPYQIEKIGYYFSDAIYLIDDFKRSNFRNESDYRAALGTIQNYADGTGRGRLRKNAGADKKTTPIRGEAVVTGEQLPEGEASSIARLLPVAVEHFGDIDRGKRTLAECHRYSAVTAALIVSGMKRNHEALQRRYDEHQQFFQKGVQGKDNYIRIAETLAASLLGFEVFMGLMMEKEVITEEQREKLTAEQRDSLRRVRSELIREVASQRASTRWLERFNQLLSTRRIRIGQEVNQAYAAMGDVDQYIPEVGFVKATQPHLVYVLADLAVSEVRKHFPDHEISTTRQAIAKQLEADKVLIRQGERLTDKVRRAGPYVPGCWAIMRDQLTLPDSTGNNVSVMEQQAEVEKSFLMLKRHAAAKVTPYVEKAVEKARESFQSLENLTSALEKQHDYVALNLDFDQRVRRLLESAEGSDKEAVQAAQRQAVQALRAANSCISSEYVSSSAPASAEKIDGNNY